jgi:glycerol-3-phosphate acyltransferase PlsX
MADVFSKDVLGVEKQRVGLLSIGEEEGKGNIQVKEAYEMLRDSSLNFMGNVEGRDVYTGDLDVVVCDGFVGNIALKLSEGLAFSFGKLLKRELTRDWKGRLGALLAKANLKRFSDCVDYAEYGGAQLLGLDGIVIVCHGASNAKAVCNAVKMSARFVENKVNEHLVGKLTASAEFTRPQKNNSANHAKRAS